MKLIRENRRLLLFLFLMLVFRSAVADWSPVPTGSMKPTIVEGDIVFINKHAYDIKLPLTNISLKNLATPERGDIVVFKSEKADLRLLKRVIGLPGDKIALRDNQLFINSQPVSYIFNKQERGIGYFTELLPDKTHEIQLLNNYSKYDSFSEIAVPEGHYFVMGDNRQNSSDSRVYGFVPHHELVGRTKRVLVSFNIKNNYLPRLDRFLKAI